MVAIRQKVATRSGQTRDSTTDKPPVTYFLQLGSTPTFHVPSCYGFTNGLTNSFIREEHTQFLLFGNTLTDTPKGMLY